MQEQQKKLHCCPREGCNSAFNRPYRLAQHLLVHDNVKAFSCSVENCSKSYTSKSHLDRHISTVHKDPEIDMIYSCPTCMKRYANRQNLKRHIKIHHVLKVPFSCDICKREFKKKNQLSAHMYDHTGIKSFSCDICTKDFVSLYDKKRHMRFHKTYSCEICQMKFNHWSKLQKHKKTDHTAKEFICNDCGRNFKQRSHMVRHVKVHNQKVPAITFSCPYENCQRLYSRNSNLKQHILIKHENCVYECEICKAHLSTKSKLNQHKKLHNKVEIKQIVIKTKYTGRRERRDKGLLKATTALKLAGISINFENNKAIF